MYGNSCLATYVVPYLSGWCWLLTYFPLPRLNTRRFVHGKGTDREEATIPTFVMVAHSFPRPRSQLPSREREVQFEDLEEQKVSVAPDSEKVSLFGYMSICARDLGSSDCHFRYPSMWKPGRAPRPTRRSLPLIDSRLVILPVYVLTVILANRAIQSFITGIPLYTTHWGTCILAFVDLSSHSLWATLTNKPSTTQNLDLLIQDIFCSLFYPPRICDTYSAFSPSLSYTN